MYNSTSTRLPSDSILLFSLPPLQKRNFSKNGLDGHEPVGAGTTSVYLCANSDVNVGVGVFPSENNLHFLTTTYSPQYSVRACMDD